MHKLPEVQDRVKAFREAAPQERFYAHPEYMMALGDELAKSKWIEFDAFPPEARAALEVARAAQPNALPPAQASPVVAPLGKVDSGHATGSEIEEVRRLAEEVMRDTRISLSFMKRIEAALSLLERS